MNEKTGHVTELSRKRVHRLSQQLANQIAAGEVVERPASVVRELLDNAIDAQATHITVSIQRGGHHLIQVSDNGSGIHPKDLWPSIARHSTSKISTIDDLSQIHTLGFRGEALASIASVSRLSIISRQAGQESAFSIETEGGYDDGQVVPIAHPMGTQIAVRDLFFNTPARKRFLKAEKTEYAHIEKVVDRFAIANPHISLCLQHNQKKRYDLPIIDNEADELRRLATILGQSFVDHLIHFEFSSCDIRCHGWLALPTYSRAQADMQYTFLNGRYVRDKLLSHALKVGFADVMFQGRQPAYIVWIDCPADSVDVNVHPSKQELRFRDASMMHKTLAHGIKDALARSKPGTLIHSETMPSAPSSSAQNQYATLIQPSPVNADGDARPSTQPSHDRQAQVSKTSARQPAVPAHPAHLTARTVNNPSRQQAVIEQLIPHTSQDVATPGPVDPSLANTRTQGPASPAHPAHLTARTVNNPSLQQAVIEQLIPHTSQDVATPRPVDPSPANTRTQGPASPAHPAKEQQPDSPSSSVQTKTAYKAAVTSPAAAAPPQVTNPAQLHTGHNGPFANASEQALGTPIAQLHGIYILTQSESGMVIIDMHAAAERILYEQLKKNIEQNQLQSQQLLLPIHLNVSQAAMNTWEQHHAIFEQLQFDITPSGPLALAVRQHPSLIPVNCIDTLIQDTLADLAELDHSHRLERTLLDILGNIACRSAIKANHILNHEEMTALVRQLEQTPNHGFCNHGRPTWHHWSLAELDKLCLRGQ